jgi:sortase (surface protein transpeptidase)
VSAATIPRPTVEAGIAQSPRSVPVRLMIPALHMSVPLTQLGLGADGTVQVPSTTTTPGWFRLGASPGQIGSAVILGHVDSYRGIGVFFYLRLLKSGDLVNVALANHTTAHFEVTSVRMFPKSSFPDERVYGSHGYSALQLVTCGGVFDAATGHYESNLVVFSSLLQISPVHH